MYDTPSHYCKSLLLLLYIPFIIALFVLVLFEAALWCSMDILIYSRCRIVSIATIKVFHCAHV